jgi:periplasmic copper chaperone A
MLLEHVMNHLRLNSRPLSGASALRAALIGLAGLIVASTQALAHEYKLGDLVIDHPWSRATLPGAKVAGGFLVIRNTGTTNDRLVSLTSGISGRAEIHEMSVTDGVMKMRPLKDGIEIPAGGEVKLEPGSYHLMFMELKAPAVEGENFGATLTFEKSGTVDVEFAVDKAGGGDHSTHGG